MVPALSISSRALGQTLSRKGNVKWRLGGRSRRELAFPCSGSPTEIELTGGYVTLAAQATFEGAHALHLE